MGNIELTEITIVAGAANELLETLAPWKAIRPKNYHSDIRQVLRTVQNATKGCFASIDDSVKRAQDLSSVLQKGEDLCGFIIESISAPDIPARGKWISELQRTLRSAPDNAQRMKKKFGSGKEHFNNAARDIKSLLERLDKKHDKESRHHAMTERYATNCGKMMQESANLPSNLAESLDGVPAGVAVIASVPFAVSGALVGVIGEVVFSTAGTGSKKWLLAYESMSEPPEQAQKNIAHALEKIDILLKYWEETQANLEAICPSTEDISDSMKMQALKEACGALRTRCALYGKEVGKWRDIYST